MLVFICIYYHYVITCNLVKNIHYLCNSYYVVSDDGLKTPELAHSLTTTLTTSWVNPSDLSSLPL